MWQESAFGGSGLQREGISALVFMEFSTQWRRLGSGNYSFDIGLEQMCHNPSLLHHKRHHTGVKVAQVSTQLLMNEGWTRAGIKQGQDKTSSSMIWMFGML